MSLGEILFIPGVTDPLTQLKSLLFKQGQAGGIWVPSLSPTMISSESFGTGVQTFLDLSGNGKNATQASSGSRPAWGRVPKSGKRNFLVNTEFAGGISGGPGTAPTGWSYLFTDSDTIFTYAPGQFTASTLLASDRVLLSQNVSVVNGETWTVSADVFVESGITVAAQLVAFRTLVSGSDVVKVNGVIATDVPVGEWARVEVTRTFTGTGTDAALLGFGTSGVRAATVVTIRKPQVEKTANATPYQRVGLTAFDITESGQRDCYYLQPDGVDDGMATASIAWGSSEFTYWVAMQKRTAIGTASAVLGLGSDPLNGNGTFELQAPGSVLEYQTSSRGTLRRTAGTLSFPAVDTAIICSEGSTESDILTFERNGTVIQTVTDDQGGGNYTASPLYMFSRAGASLFANCQVYGVIAVSGRYSASTKSRVNSILSRYTPEVSL